MVSRLAQLVARSVQIMTDTTPNHLLSRDDIERETAGGITRRWLELAAHRGEGPPFLKISRRMVRYRRDDFYSWLEAQRVDGSDAGR